MTENISARPSGTGPMLSMTHSFSRSSTVIKQLARDTARTPPSSEDPPLEYIDRSLTILGRTFDTHTSECSKEFLAQREFIGNGFREMDRRFEEVENKMDRRFEEVDRRFEELENKMDRRFEEVDRRFEEVDRRFEELENKMDRRFEELENKMDRRFEEVDRRFDDVTVQLENAAAITRNGHLRRMHQPINLIKVLKPTGNPNRFVWGSHPQVPKHMKNTYVLGQRAKGIFEPSWGGKPTEQSMYLMVRCFVCTFCSLCISSFTTKSFSYQTRILSS